MLVGLDDQDLRMLGPGARRGRMQMQLAKAAAEAKTSVELWRALSDGLMSALEADRVTPVTIEGPLFVTASR